MRSVTKMSRKEEWMDKGQPPYLHRDSVYLRKLGTRHILVCGNKEMLLPESSSREPSPELQFDQEKVYLICAEGLYQVTMDTGDIILTVVKTATVKDISMMDKPTSANTRSSSARGAVDLSPLMSDSSRSNQVLEVTSDDIFASGSSADVGLMSDSVGPTKVLLTGVPKGATEEGLRDFLENVKRQGGGEVMKLDLNHADSTAIVEFVETEAVEILMRKAPVTYHGEKIQVEICRVPDEGQGDQACTVEVRGLPGTCRMSQQLLEMYFKSEKWSGGAEVEWVDLHRDEGLAYVTFKSPSVAQRVLTIKEHSLSGQPFQVMAFNPALSKSPTLNVVKMKGFGEDYGKEKLESFFRNKDGFVKMDVDFTEEVAYVTFTTEKEARRVIQGTFELDDKLLSVTLYNPIPNYKDRVFISDLNPTTTRDCLHNFLEAKTGVCPAKFISGEKSGSVLVIFEKVLDIDQLQEICKLKALEGSHLSVARVPFTNSVRVTGHAPSTSTDTLLFYFDNRRRSGGGPVEKVIRVKEEDCFLVYFEDYHAVDQVTQRTHNVDGKMLTVTPFIEFLGQRKAKPDVQQSDKVPVGSQIRKSKKDTKISAVSKSEMQGAVVEGKSVQSSDDVLEVSRIVVSPLLYNIFMALTMYKETRQKFQDDGVKLDYETGFMTVTGLCQKVKQASGWIRKVFEILKKQKIAEVVKADANNFHSIQKQTEVMEWKGTDAGVVYLSGKQAVFVIGINDEEMMAVMNQFLLKIERKKTTERSRGQKKLETHPSKSNDPSDAVLQDQSVQHAFSWSKDAKSLELYRTGEGLCVFVYEGNLLNAPVDCIVNATNENLQHGGGIARVISMAAGPVLTKEGNDYIRRNGSLRVGTAISTTAGKLSYKCVIHTVGPCWYDYSPYSKMDVDRCEADLFNAIFNSFLEAEKRGLKTIALPAVSSAIFGVPAEVCVLQYVKATIEYSSRLVGVAGSLTGIHFVDKNRSIVLQIQEVFNSLLVDKRQLSYNKQQYVKQQK